MIMKKKLLEDKATRWALIRDIMMLVNTHASTETDMLIRIHEKDPRVPLFVLSEKTSEQIFSFQAIAAGHLDAILADGDLVWAVLESYTPAILVKNLGRDAILDILNSEKLKAYRNAIITKKLAAIAFYKNGLDWEAYMDAAAADFSGTVRALFAK